jgi:CPA1 family monovalent cation:H+ antiporter
MTALDLALRFMLVAAAVSIITERLRAPYTVALVVAGLVIGNMHLVPPIAISPEVLLTLLIPPLLFEGGLRLPPVYLKTHGALIGLLAIPGTVVTAVAIGWTVHMLFHLELKSAMLLGAAISATDPVSVLALLREARTDPRLGAVLEGEAVLNDGVAIILFTVILGGTAGLAGTTLQFLWLLAGGVMIGSLVALATSYALGRTEQHLVEALGSLIAALGSLVAANSVGASGVIAVVTAGVVFGSQSPRHLTEAGVETVRTTWDLIAFLANSVLFLLIGLEVPATLLVRHWALIATVIAAAFAARAGIVYVCAAIRRGGISLAPAAWRSVLVWGALRGGVTVALALDVAPAIPGREAIVATAFGIVVFTLLVQGSFARVMMRRAVYFKP